MQPPRLRPAKRELLIMNMQHRADAMNAAIDQGKTLVIAQGCDTIRITPKSVFGVNQVFYVTGAGLKFHNGTRITNISGFRVWVES